MNSVTLTAVALSITIHGALFYSLPEPNKKEFPESKAILYRLGPPSLAALEIDPPTLAPRRSTPIKKATRKRQPSNKKVVRKAQKKSIKLAQEKITKIASKRRENKIDNLPAPLSRQEPIIPQEPTTPLDSKDQVQQETPQKVSNFVASDPFPSSREKSFAKPKSDKTNSTLIQSKDREVQSELSKKSSKKRNQGPLIDMNLVRDDFMKRLNRLKRYPYAARRRGLEGRVLFEVFFKKDGLINKITLIKSSGYDLLDNNARRLIIEVGSALHGTNQEISLQIPIVYLLQEPT